MIVVHRRDWGAYPLLPPSPQEKIIWNAASLQEANNSAWNSWFSYVDDSVASYNLA